MASIKKDIVANLIGKVWSATIIILLIPQYIKFLGIESYGLIGFYATLIGSMSILDLGLSTTLNRELAKYQSENRSIEGVRNLAFSLEIIYCLIGLFICFLVVFFSGLIAKHWVNVENLPIETVKISVILMGVVIAFQWPISLYSGGLIGLDKQVLNNSITVIMNTVKAVGVLIVLKYFSPTLQAFFLWQAFAVFLHVLIIRNNFWKKMPSHILKPKFSRAQLKNVWKFAVGMTGIGFITFFLAQVDKIVLSNILSLSQFGYYTLAFTIATSVSLIVVPISTTFFPRFTNLVASKNEVELKILYHKACRLMSALIFPTCFVLLFFMKDVLAIWTNNSVTTENTYLMAQLLVIGCVFNSLMVMPYNLLIANGWTRFTIYQNTIAAIVLVPSLFVLTNLYGAFGAIALWILLNVGYVFISLPLMHKKLLRHELKNWYLKDTLIPMLGPLVTILILKAIVVYGFPNLTPSFFVILFVSIITLGVSLLNLPSSKEIIQKLVKR
jgi:O-antigen/teichoic acid export membrane protein